MSENNYPVVTADEIIPPEKADTAKDKGSLETGAGSVGVNAGDVRADVSIVDNGTKIAGITSEGPVHIDASKKSEKTVNNSPADTKKVRNRFDEAASKATDGNTAGVGKDINSPQMG